MVITYTRPDGVLIVVIPAPEWRLAGESDAAFASRVISKDVPANATNVSVIDSGLLPKDRTFRNAWRNDNGTVSVDMTKAREIHRDKLRAMRAPLLGALDVQYIRALETGDTEAMATVAAQKEVLRDATEDPSIDIAATPEELKAAIPDCLKATDPYSPALGSDARPQSQ